MTFQKLSFYRDFLGPRVLFYALMAMITGLAIFVGDIGIALSLQRLFTSVGLLAETPNVHIPWPLQDKYTETAFLVFIGLIRLVFMWANYFAKGATVSLVEAEKRQQISFAAHHDPDQSMGKILTLYSDIVAGSAVCISNASFALSRLVIAIGLFGTLVYVSPVLSCFVLVPILILAPLQKYLTNLTSFSVTEAQSYISESINLLTRHIKNNLYLRIHHLVTEAEKQVRDKIDRSVTRHLFYYRIHALRAVFPQAVGLLTVAAITLLGSHYFSDAPGVILSFLFLTVRFFQSLSEIANVSGGIWMNLPRVHILTEWYADHAHFLRAKGDKINTPLSPLHDPIGFTAQNLSYHYPNGGQTAIQDLSFSIPPGGLALVTGPSGSGKTTLIHLLLGLRRGASGTLTWQTRHTPPVPVSSALPATASYVSSDHFLVAGTIRDQLAIGLSPLPEDAHLWAALSQVGGDFVRDLPGGLDYKITEQGEGLSAGQKQRIALARALLRRPSLLLLDEATANLDIETETQVLSTINALRGHVTVIMITHRIPSDISPDIHIELGKDR